MKAVLAWVKRRIGRIRAEFPRLWKYYLYQSLMATIVVFLILLTLTLENAVVVASIGATAFIVFATPKNPTAKPRRVIGGHIIGLVVGSGCAAVPHESTIIAVGIYALSVGITIWAMVALDFEHPPAAGTALGVSLTGFSPAVMAAVITSTVIMSLAHHFCKRYLRDLM